MKCVEFSLIIFTTGKKDCVIKTKEMFRFLPPIKVPATIELSFLLLSLYVFYLDWVLQSFYKYHPYHSSIQ